VKTNEFNIKWNASDKEDTIRNNFLQLFKKCPIPENEILLNLSLFIKRQDLSQILFMHELYKQIIGIHGIVVEFGVRWGKNMALFESFRGIYEPFNHNRKIVGFDTFSGFPEVDAKDGKGETIMNGGFSVTNQYEKYLSQVLDYHEQESPISHIKKYELVKGDATIEVEKYLNENPETIIAFAYFDFDIYKPTKICLEAILPHLTKGSIIGFDELNCHDYPGETLALKEIVGYEKHKVNHSVYSPTQSYILFE
jgi:hypothetical protein